MSLTEEIITVDIGVKIRNPFLIKYLEKKLLAGVSIAGDLTYLTARAMVRHPGGKINRLSCDRLHSLTPCHINANNPANSFPL